LHQLSTKAKYLGTLNAIALLAATGCGGTQQGSPRAAPASPTINLMVGAPKVGACRDLTEADVELTSVEMYVPCDGVHTSLVVAVSELPGELSPTSTNEELSEHMYKVCAKPGREALGGSVILRRTSLFRPLFFLPSTGQRKQGARWFACDISANDEEGMIPLPAATPFLVKPAGDTKPIKRTPSACDSTTTTRTPLSAATASTSWRLASSSRSPTRRPRRVSTS
jgi:hypothetical protein